MALTKKPKKPIKSKKEIENSIDEIKNKLTPYTQQLEESKIDVALYYIEEIAFMRAILDDMKMNILNGGCIDDYQNGANQQGQKQSASIQAYNSTMKTYNKTLKQFMDLFGKDVKKTGADDEFMQFLNKSKVVKR